MINFIIGAICGIAIFLIFCYIQYKIEDRIFKKDLGEDYQNVIMSKSEYEKIQKYMKDISNK